MKKTILLAAMAACLFATNVFAQKIKGSDTWFASYPTAPRIS